MHLSLNGMNSSDEETQHKKANDIAKNSCTKFSSTSEDIKKENTKQSTIFKNEDPEIDVKTAVKIYL